MSVLLLTADLACSSQVTAAGQRAGTTVTLAMSVPRLLESAAQAAIDLVILDLNTPGLNCSDLLPKLKSLPTPPKTVIAFGPHVHEARLAAAGEAGCDRVLARGAFYAQLDQLLTE